MDEYTLLYPAWIIGLALFAGTLRSIKFRLVDRPADQARLRIAWSCWLLEMVAWTGSLVVCIFAAPHPITLLLILLLIVTCGLLAGMRYREESESINRWIRVSMPFGNSLPELLDDLANGCHFLLASRAKACVKRLQRGETIEDAVRRSKFPMDGDTVVALITSTPNSVAGASFIELHPARLSQQASSSSARTRTRFAYVIATIFLAWVVGIFVRTVLFDSVDAIIYEEDVWRDSMLLDTSLRRGGLEKIATIGDIVVAVGAVWLLLAALIRWMPRWVVRCTPWFGRRAIDKWRCEILHALERGLRAGNSERQILPSLARSMPTRWIRSRCRAAFQLVQGGVPLCQALQRASIVSAREQKWLASAITHGSFPDAVGRLCDDVQRRQERRWDFRMTWFVPTGTLLVGTFILAHALYLFWALTGWIQYLAVYRMV